ncbi:MAG: hypothetical protein NT004_19385 [Bacteroidetes bacterium]|nr:hypothetical protein [Bacteroidota bacterium]
MTDRTAIDTIKGYFYQFDFSILKILELPNDTDSVVIEGIEDLDIKTATEENAIQCKYYSKTEYNHSVISKPIRLMLSHYSEMKNDTKNRINYNLYGFYQSGQHKLTLPIDIDFLKNNFLTHTKDKVKYFHHEDLGLSDADLNDFLTLLTININALEYDTQLKQVFESLKLGFNCTDFEAEHFFYNNSLKVIKEIAIKGDVNDRRVRKLDFISRIDSKKILFNEWFIQFKGEKRFFADLRARYFSALNTSPFERFFLIEVSNLGYSRPELKELLFIISKKWSKISKREPKPFCPYVYIHNLPINELIELKREMYDEDFVIIDGFDFAGSAFSPKSIIRKADFTNQIKLKFVNELNHFSLIINEIKKVKYVFQFYLSNPFIELEQPSIKHTKIQIKKFIDIKEII